jgi:hypothetical protein
MLFNVRADIAWNFTRMTLSRSLPIEEGVPLNFPADYIAANAVAFNPENLHGHNINLNDAKQVLMINSLGGLLKGL